MSTKEKTRLLMEACKGKERDDQSAKSFFHRKDFLANVLKISRRILVTSVMSQAAFVFLCSSFS